jgi:hypothetical protein
MIGSIGTLWDAGEQLTGGRLCPRRWSPFQVAWAALHASAVLMHVVSVIYHARRVTERDRLGKLLSR